MTRHQHNGYVRVLASNTELFKSGTFIITDEWSSVQEAAGRLDEVFIAESIVTRPARALAGDEDDDESGMDIQVIDVEDDDAGEDEDDEELDEEFDAEASEQTLSSDLAEDDSDEDEFVEVIEDEFDDDDDEGDSAYNAVSLALTSGDVDVDWKRAEITGEETPGGSVAAPDQDVVDLIGRAAGVVYDDDEPLDFAEKVGQRDRYRWELDPASVDPDIQELSEELTPPESQRKGLKIETRS